jgi:hypothetical protein
MTVKLGDRARDRVTGYTGICVARIDWLDGSKQLMLQAPADEDNALPEAQTFSETMVTLVAANQVKSRILSQVNTKE